MRFKLDESLPQELEEDLRRLGHDADSIASEGLADSDDDKVVRATNDARRILLALDKAIPRLFQRRRETGPVLFRPDSLGQLNSSWNFDKTKDGKSSLFAFPLKPRSCPDPSTGSKNVFAGISLRADSISSIDPKGSRVPWTNKVGT